MRLAFTRRNFTRIAICGLLMSSMAATAQADKDDLYIVHVDGKRGYMDSSGQLKIKPQFDDAHHFADGVAFVKKGGKWGLIDQTGQFLVEAKFDDCRNCLSNVCSVKLGDKWGFINHKGDVVIPIQFDVARGFEDSGATPQENFHTARVVYHGKWELIDPRGNVLLASSVLDALHVTALDALEQGLAGVKVGDKWGYIDRTGKWVIEPQFASSGGFGNGYAAVQRDSNGAYGYIDTKGNVVIPYRYEDAGEFEEGTQPPKGLAPVKTEGKWGYIDRNGKLVIQPQYDGARQFENELAEVQPGDTYGYINHSGKYVWKPSK
jgi:hypothetical protein